MLNNGLRQDCTVNAVTIGTHLWYKLHESQDTISYMYVEGISAQDDLIKGSRPLDFNCLHVNNHDSAFHCLTLLDDVQLVSGSTISDSAESQQISI